MAAPLTEDAFTARERTWRLPLRDGCVLTNGYQSWSDAELQSLGERQARPTLDVLIRQGHDVAWPPSGEQGVWRSHTLIALIDRDGRGWVGSALSAATSFARWEARLHDDHVELRYSAEGETEPAVLVRTDDVIGTVEHLAARLGQAMHARTPAPLRVWCSWYSYYRAVSAPAILENARVARDQQLPFDVFQLDDGFQADLGDWLQPSAHFAGHARDLPAQLHDLGFRAGLWLAPFIARPTSQLFQRHPQWFLRDAHGQLVNCGDNWGGPYHALDTTRDDVQDWLEGLAREVTGWGYDYLKLDFLFAGAMPGIRARDVSRAEAYRLGLAALRRGAGDGTFLLACGAPLAASIGLADAMRTGPDVAPLWDDYARRLWLHDTTGPAARNAVHTCLSRWYQHHWYQNDPDVMIARRKESLLNDAERASLLGLLDVIGGLRASSDPLPSLTEEEVQQLREALTISTPDRPLTLTESLGAAPTHFTRGTFNLTDSPEADGPPHGFTRRAADRSDSRLAARKVMS